MTVETFEKSINGISIDFIDEAAHAGESSEHRQVFIKYAGVAAVFFILITGGLVALNIPATIIQNKKLDGGNTQISISDSKSVDIRGTVFSDYEVNELIKENKDIIALNISAEYDCFGEEIHIFNKGYYHVVIGETTCVDLDYLTLPVCINNKIVADLEVYRTDGKTGFTLNAGGDKWETINKAIGYSEDIAFVFGGGFAGEAAIAPDGTVFEITRGAGENINSGYDILATEYNTFSQSLLYNSDNYITVVSEK
ncbi:MAG: hypothetical protein PUB89_08885 [Oscillospiraceae bacterium]|nr:hypothetical protein [Oscillospiraceae bacterium]